MEFFAAGAHYRERCFLAANRVGRSWTGACGVRLPPDRPLPRLVIGAVQLHRTYYIAIAGNQAADDRVDRRPLTTGPAGYAFVLVGMRFPELRVRLNVFGLPVRQPDALRVQAYLAATTLALGPTEDR